MENKLDKLFRDKLEQHSIEPSALAWEKVTSASRPLTPEGLPSGQAGGTSATHLVWAWRIAAAVALLAVAGWFAFDFGRNETIEITKDTTTEKTEQEVVANVKIEIEEPVAKKKVQDPVQHSVSKSMVKQSPAPQLTITQPEKENVIENIEPEQTIASVEEVIEPVAIQELAVQAKANKSMVIVYNLAPVELKQEMETAKANTFKKVIEFAKDVKGGEGTTLASVRNWKDNLFGSEEQTRVEKHHNN